MNPISIKHGELAERAMHSMLAVLKDGESVDIIYRMRRDRGRAKFSLQLRATVQGDTARDATDQAVHLRRNLRLALDAQPGLRFDEVVPDVDADRSEPRWQAVLRPRGLLISTQQRPQSLPRAAASAVPPPHDVLITPLLPGAPSTFTVIDAVLASPHPIDVVVALRPRRLDERDQLGLRHVLAAMEQGNAAYLLLPERRRASAEEHELLEEDLARHLKRWLVSPYDLSLRCTTWSAGRPSDTWLVMLGQALFPQQSFAVSIAAAAAQAALEPAHDPLVGAVDLQGCINATWRPPALLFNLIRQDIARGEGVCLIDPHGDLYREVLDAVPAGRARDVVLIDPCDFDRAVGINFLECSGPYPQVQMNLIVNEMIKIFDRLYDLRQTGGPIFEQYMRNALLLVMDNDTPGTLMNVPRVFEDESFRKTLKQRCRNPLVERFWSKLAERAAGDASLANMGPYITSKLNQFTHNALLRPIIGQRHSTIHFRQVMDRRQILLVNLSKRMLGELDTQLLGMILIGKVFFAAMGRVDVPETQRTPFYWYIDEFQNFTTDTLAHLLSESRKFGICLTLANQNMAQLSHSYGTSHLIDAVLGNVGNLLIFRVGAADAAKLATHTDPELGAQDLQYLPDFHAVARLLKNHVPLRPFVVQTVPRPHPAIGAKAARLVKDAILKHSRRRYTRPVAGVENEILGRPRQ